MSILSRFARSKDSEAILAALPTECGHWELAPRWENAADMGKKDKITSYTCVNCKEALTLEEAESVAAAAV